ncbi:sodium:proton exchanger [Candidatus Parcubacteria bacterium]|nr:MAG: sodium:proton exchanger [Candidatus Parcubacteria bacterium]
MEAFGEIAILIGVAAVVSGVMRLLRQPLIIGYILTGLLVGPFLFNVIHSQEILNLFSEIGISFLLFIVGLSLTPTVIRRFGRIALLTSIGQVFATLLVILVIALLLGFPPLTAIYLGIALAFSSTIIVLKLLSDKKDFESLYGKIAVGFLLVQDFIALFLLFFLPLASVEQENATIVSVRFIIGILLAVVIFFLASYSFKKLSSALSRSQEFLFLFSIAWGLGVAAVFKYLGLSPEAGALLAGVSLSTLPWHHEVAARLKPLRDFFIILFFIFLGSKLSITELPNLLVPALIFSAVVLLGKPLILMAIMGLEGYRKKTGFQIGLLAAQISEFSLILVALGVKLGHLDASVLSLTTLVGLLTIFGSTYLILYTEKLYPLLRTPLSIFERKKVRREGAHSSRYSCILFGYNRIGYDFLKTFLDAHRSFLVVDYDPEVIDELEKKKFPYVFGDASDIELLETLPIDKATTIISTIPDLETNLLILRHSRNRNRNALIMLVAHNINEALLLYREGADYVIMPHFLGGKYASLLMKRLNFKKGKDSEELKHEHLDYLRKRREAGHEHPVPEKLHLS